MTYVFWLPLVVFYTVGFVGAFTPSFEETAMALINSEHYWSAYESELLLIERLEALFWLIGCVGFCLGTLRQRLVGPRLWLAFFFLICFAALGEETSWGQHYLGYQPPSFIAEMNAQNELNLHNTDLAAIFDVSPEDPLFPYFGNLTHYLNPLFYIFCLCVWGVMPILTRTRWRKVSAVMTYPLYGRSFYTALWGFSGLFLVADRLFFDAGELLELTLATVGGYLGLLTALERYDSCEEVVEPPGR